MTRFLKRKIFNLVAFVSITLLLGVGQYYQQIEGYLQKAFYSFLALSIVYFLYIIIEKFFSPKISVAKTRYSFRRTLSIFYLVILFIILMAIWVENTQALLVSYGLIAAGITISLQDFFKNLTGGLILFINRNIKVGDRIELKERRGDVIDINFLYTTLLELNEWSSGDQPTGRLIILPNRLILSELVTNYNKDHNFIWEDLKMPITYNSDWQKAIKIILQLVKKETKSTIEVAEKGIKRLERRYYLPRKSTEPKVLISLTDNWIELSVRYIVEVRNRSEERDRISRLILNALNKEKNIKISSETLTVYNK
ncbi:MAG: mechanosensitive ion channel [Candidatus Buchananbacteria bacterium]|nr:mechanosensitive ion channel [Candidatus Buchananbacteria bacterium]